MSRAAAHRGVSPAGDPAWIVQGHETIRKLLTDERINRFPPPGAKHPSRFTTAEILQFRHLDSSAPPPPDDLIRRMVATSFSGRRMAALEPIVQDIARRLVTEMRAAGPPSEIRSALAEPLSSHVISELLGIPPHDRERMRELSDRSVDLSDPESSAAADRELKTYMERLLDAKAADLADDVLSDMLRLRMQEPALFTRELVIGIAAGLRFAGQINTVTLIERGVLLLLTHPDQLAEARRGNELSNAAVEEILRYPHPVQRRVAGVPRYAHADLPVGDVTIVAGDLVILDLDEANVDDRIFADVDKFSTARQENPHLSFGYGPHYCVGAALARIELKAAFVNLFELLPDLRLDCAVSELAPRRNQLSGGVLKLPVTWVAD